MEWSFGIVTKNDNPHFLKNLISSIRNQNIKKYEIIVCGGIPIKDTIHIPFDETIKNGWITRKKNLIVERANYNNICILHDYFVLDDYWYKGFCDFDCEWDIAQTKILNKNGERFSDWVIHNSKAKEFYFNNSGFFNSLKKIYPNFNNSWEFFTLTGVPYNYYGLVKQQYISGGQIICKKQVLLDEKFDESRCWGEDEDTEWSFRINAKYKIKMNQESVTHIQKPDKWHIEEMPYFLIEKMQQYFSKYE